MMHCFESNKSYFAKIPTRVVFVFLSFLGISLFYAYKAMLSVTIVAMVKQQQFIASNSSAQSQQCYTAGESTNIDLYTKNGEFYWTVDQQALILGAFFYGDIFTQLPAGILTKKIGVKWIFGSSVLIAALMSLLGPIAASVHYILFFVTRLVQGLADGVTYPCIIAMLSRWMPKTERSRGTAIIFGVSQIGTIIALPLSGALCNSPLLGGWRSPFYLLGVLGIIWFLFWALFISETPDTHPRISLNEYNYIKLNQTGECGSERSEIPWKQIFTSIPVYALIITHFGQMWGFLTVLTLLPTYFTKILHFDITKNGLVSSIPYALQAIVSFIASYFSDKCRQSGKLSITAIRKFNNTIAFLGPALCLLLVILSGCNSLLNIVFFTLAMALNGFGYSGIKSTHLDMAPDFAGTLMALSNTFACLPGFLSPIIAAKIYSSGQTLTNWSYIFYLSSAIYIFTAIIYLMFGTAKLQLWGVSNKEKNLLFNSSAKKYGTIFNANI